MLRGQTPDQTVSRKLYRVEAVTLLTAIDATHAVEVVDHDSGRLWHVRLNHRDSRWLAVYRFRGIPGEYDRNQFPVDPACRDFYVYPITKADLTKKARLVEVPTWSVLGG